MAGTRQRIKWTNEQPAAIIVVLLILAIALLYPGGGCDRTPSTESTPAAAHGH